jgi:hypothetical protein
MQTTPAMKFSCNLHDKRYQVGTVSPLTGTIFDYAISETARNYEVQVGQGKQNSTWL